MNGFNQTIESVFWSKMNEQKALNQKGMPYDHLRVSGKTGFYKDGEDEPFGIVERVLAHETYYIKSDIA